MFFYVVNLSSSNAVIEFMDSYSVLWASLLPVLVSNTFPNSLEKGHPIKMDKVFRISTFCMFDKYCTVRNVLLWKYIVQYIIKMLTKILLGTVRMFCYESTKYIINMLTKNIAYVALSGKISSEFTLSLSGWSHKALQTKRSIFFPVQKTTLGHLKSVTKIMLELGIIKTNSTEKILDFSSTR